MTDSNTPSSAPSQDSGLHPEVSAFLTRLERLDQPAYSELTPDEARVVLERRLAGETPRSLEDGIERVEDRTIAGPGGEIPIRIYWPEGVDDDCPTILYVHGGGWVLGNLDSHDPTCRKLTLETDAVVVSVDYRLAPEHPFPAGLEDCYAALEWVAGPESESALGGDASPLVLAGDSAGGNLATATALWADYRDGPEIDAQLLLYPVTDTDLDTDSYRENAEGYMLTRESMRWFLEHYLERRVDELNPLVAPLRAPESVLSELPPAIVLTAGFDPLRDDGAAYAARLEAAGVPVTYREYDDVIHGFLSLVAEPVALERAEEAWGDVASELEAVLSDELGE